jgi:hypothetical protein
MAAEPVRRETSRPAAPFADAHPARPVFHPFVMTASTAPALRQRTCRACGKKFDYPVKGGAATRHHCEDCVAVPPETRKVLERLNSRVTQLERQLASLSRRPPEKPAP